MCDISTYSYDRFLLLQVKFHWETVKGALNMLMVTLDADPCYDLWAPAWGSINAPCDAREPSNPYAPAGLSYHSIKMC